MPRDKRLLRRAFDRAAADYDRNADLQHDVAESLLERLDYIRIAPGSVLDLGCGTGRATRQLSRRYRGARVVGVDLSPGMLRRARRPGLPLLARPRYVCGDLERLPVVGGWAELLYSSLALQWSEDLPAAFQEAVRVAAPGAPFLFATLGAGTLLELREAWDRAAPGVHVNQFVDLHDVGDQLAAAGFRDVVMDAERQVRHVPDVRTLMLQLKAIGARNINPGRPQGLTGPRRLARVTAAYEALRTPAGLPVTWEVVYGHGWAPDAPGAVPVAFTGRRP